MPALSKEADLWFVETVPLMVPNIARVRREAVLHQMTASKVKTAPATIEFVPLVEADVPEMIALAHLTKPGPFAARTHQLGRFVGVKDRGKLIAMAGERMKFDGFAEVSGVCTHPDYRGKGYAAALICAVAQDMLERHETPFLHCYVNNPLAIKLYESLGFTLRHAMCLTVIEAQPGSSKLESP